MRPTATLFPLAGLIAACAGGEARVWPLFIYCFVMQLCSLCAADAFRNGAAREAGVRRVDRRFSGALVQLIPGIVVLCLLMGRNDGASIGLIAAAICINIEQMFEERMFALGRSLDGAILSGIANLLLLLGLLLDQTGGVELGLPLADEFTLCGAGLGAIIALISCYLVEPSHGFSLKPVNLALSPVAMVQTLLYPGVLLAGTLIFECTRPPQLASALYGLAIWRLSRSICRRSRDESRPLNLLLLLCVAVPLLAALWIPACLPFACLAFVALLCAALVFCAPALNFYLGIALLIGASLLYTWAPLPATWNLAATCALCLAAIAVNLRRVFLRRVKVG